MSGIRPSRDYEFVASGIDANRMGKKKKKEARRPLNALDLFSFKRIPPPPVGTDGSSSIQRIEIRSSSRGGKSCFPRSTVKKNVLLISRYGTGDFF